VGQVVKLPAIVAALAAKMPRARLRVLSIDTLFATGVIGDTVTLSATTPPDSLSDSLQVELADTIESSAGADSLTVPLAGRPVVYAITYAAPGAATLVTTDTAHALVTLDTVTTGANGVAFVKVRLLADALPDSIVVTARARRAIGDTVPGSPITFFVRFQP